ncbi:hypothetical protein [Spirillospora sp. NPDC047279]|uniref:hypothetical protein n=1 Tax=Spirillospora sp. NPDC047279 TaxID=3155478 RepID=UPI0033DDD427
MTTVVETKGALQRDFPEWNIVRGDKGRWYAFRGPQPGQFAQPGRSCVEAGDSESLREQLSAVVREEAGL